MDGDVFLPHPSFLGALGGLGGLCVSFGCSGVREGGCSVVRGERFPGMDIPFVAAPPPLGGGLVPSPSLLVAFAKSQRLFLSILLKNQFLNGKPDFN